MGLYYDFQGARSLDRALARAKLSLDKQQRLSEEDFKILHSLDLSNAEEWALWTVAQKGRAPGFESRPGGSGGPPGSPRFSTLLTVENTAAGFAKFEQVNNYVKPKVTRNEWLTRREAKKLHELRNFKQVQEQRKSDRDDYDISGSSAPFVRRPPKDPPGLF